ncbi:MAG TPA: biopolymer transporter ExbD, partial [Terriglobales bacterium]|nr:biopolymer transporter ExbD [Terriglobales bacterium]
YLGNEQVTPDQLEGRIRDRLANKVDKRVYINADARAKYGGVVEVVDNVRAAGVDLVGLLTQQRRQGAAAVRPPGQ